MWRVPTIWQCNFTIHAAVCLIPVQDCAYLCLHRLWWVNIRARPVGNSSQLPKKSQVEERGIRDNLIVLAMYPEYWWLHLTGDKIVLPQIFRRERVVHSLPTGS